MRNNSRRDVTRLRRKFKIHSIAFSRLCERNRLTHMNKKSIIFSSEWRMHPDTGKVTDDILSIRTKTHRYVVYKNSGEEEFYGHANDPFELDNRASKKTNASALSKLAERLQRHKPGRGSWPAPTAPW